IAAHAEGGFHARAVPGAVARGDRREIRNLHPHREEAHAARDLPLSRCVRHGARHGGLAMSMKSYREDDERRIVREQAASWLCELADGEPRQKEAFVAWLKRS